MMLTSLTLPILTNDYYIFKMKIKENVNGFEQRVVIALG